jgi:hypothetical protein
VNCRHVQNELLTPRDTPLGVPSSSALQTHLADCAECRAIQQQLLAATDSWRETDAQVNVPQAQAEWHSVRRRLRQAEPSTASSGWWHRTLQFGGPLTAAVAIAFVVWNGRSVTPEATIDSLTAIPTTNEVAQNDDPWAEFADHFAYASNVEYVETENEDSSPFVYVDDESGWLIVWASSPPANASI